MAVLVRHDVYFDLEGVREAVVLVLAGLIKFQPTQHRARLLGEEMGVEPRAADRRFLAETLLVVEDQLGVAWPVGWGTLDEPRDISYIRFRVGAHL